VAPAAYTSVRPSIVPARACSGAMYAGVPTMVPRTVMGASPVSFATPKSTTLARKSPGPIGTRHTLSGFTSRWTMPARWGRGERVEHLGHEEAPELDRERALAPELLPEGTRPGAAP
jgi:hypothetical protein